MSFITIFMYRWGDDMDYWGGADPVEAKMYPGQVTCACWMSKSCEDPIKHCNCDNQVSRVVVYPSYMVVFISI